ncbi:Uncharacterised protein [Mycobacteroides abscessus subsp. abscessus]|nr:Uncharacterised protein [Mycobacteroides abscessus subsp. abscessus]
MGPRSLITMVPAKMSPSRLPLAEARLAMTAGAPINMKISTTADRARMTACRRRSGPPSSDTTRNPMAILPSERPRVAISQRTG